VLKLLPQWIASSTQESNPQTVRRTPAAYLNHPGVLLGRLAYRAWETILETYRDLAGDRGALPGMIAGIQTFGELLHFHPHIHALVTDGVYHQFHRDLPERRDREDSPRAPERSDGRRPL
jgi:hypothetical protein